ncbi:MAG: hypothetical protein HUK00_00020, partial [Bacteroidaceae bacterium]|nr:hypothetical protein [Bacteroidaceae bacterium]
DLFIDYVPLYSKFRTVSSILVVAEFTIPLLAILGLHRLIQLTTTPNTQNSEAQAPAANRAVAPTSEAQAPTTKSAVAPKSEAQAPTPRSAEAPQSPLRPLLIAAGALALIAALIALIPDLFVTRFVSAGEQEMLDRAAAAGYIPQEMIAGIIANLTDIRHAIVAADAWRSFGFILAATVVLALLILKKIDGKTTTALILTLCLADMWTVNKRYLNDAMFSKPHNVEQSFAKTDIDNHILQDTALDYRVLNFATDTYNENETSYWHKSVGGYSAVKLQRYQDLIEYAIHPASAHVFEAVSTATEDSLHNAYNVINMLNTRWFIFPAKEGASVPVHNPYAFGNAWFVNNIKEVNNPDEEIDALNEVDLRRTAVMAKDFMPGVKPSKADSTATIRLTDYEPNRLTYEVNGNGGLAVFSEIYYPGWRATLEDGTEIPVARANYVLRAATIPAGHHTLTLSFDPTTIHVTEAVAWSSWAVLVLLALLAIFLAVRGRKPDGQND